MTSFTIRDIPDIPKALEWTKSMVERGLGAPERGPVVITMGRETRTQEQNDKFWPMLRDISKQVEWMGMKLREDEWKDLSTASFRSCKVLPNLNKDGVVAVGLSTSKMPKGEMSNYIEYLYAFGAENGVKWSEESDKAVLWARGDA